MVSYILNIYNTCRTRGNCKQLNVMHYYILLYDVIIQL